MGPPHVSQTTISTTEVGTGQVMRHPQYIEAHLIPMIEIRHPLSSLQIPQFQMRYLLSAPWSAASIRKKSEWFWICRIEGFWGSSPVPSSQELVDANSFDDVFTIIGALFTNAASIDSTSLMSGDFISSAKSLQTE